MLCCLTRDALSMPGNETHTNIEDLENDGSVEIIV